MAKRAKIGLASPPTNEPAVRPSSRAITQLIGGHFPPATFRKFAHLATDTGKTKQELLQEALDDLFAKYQTR